QILLGQPRLGRDAEGGRVDGDRAGRAGDGGHGNVEHVGGADLVHPVGRDGDAAVDPLLDQVAAVAELAVGLAVEGPTAEGHVGGGVHVGDTGDAGVEGDGARAGDANGRAGGRAE